MGVVLALLTSWCLGACGAASTGGPSPASPSSPSPGQTAVPTVSGSTSATVDPPDSELFPLTITRSGGIAGVQDSVVVGADGSARLRTRGGSGSCVVGEAGMDLLREVSTALVGASTVTLPPTADVADGYVVTVSSPRGRALLADPLVGAGATEVQLLLDTAGQPPTAGSPCG